MDHLLKVNYTEQLSVFKLAEDFCWFNFIYQL